MSSDVAVVVEENSSHDGTNDASRDETSAGVDHAEETIIDGAIGAGVASERASDAASEAGTSAIEATIAADNAEAAASAIHAENQSLAQIAADLRAATANLAAITAAQSEQQTGELGEPGDITDPVIDIEPENSHWLSKKWNFGRGKKVE